MSEVTEIGKAVEEPAGRQVHRQAQRENAKYKTCVERYWKELTPVGAGWNDDLVLVAPPGAVLSPNSKIDPSQIGKIPMLYNKQEGCWFGYGWTKQSLTLKQSGDGSYAPNAGIGLKGKNFPGLDIDCENAEQVKQINDMALRHLGISPVRYRDSSPRCLRVYKPKTEPLRFRRGVSWVEESGVEHTVEFLGDGRFFVCEGIHPKSGDRYKWVDDKNPCVWGPDNYSLIDDDMLDAFFAELRGIIELLDWGRLFCKGRKKSGSQRKSVDDPSLFAPSPQHVLRVLKAWPNTPENVPTHHAFVEVMAAIYGALGPHREEYYSDVWEWASEYPGITEDYVRGRWDSFQ